MWSTYPLWARVEFSFTSQTNLAHKEDSTNTHSLFGNSGTSTENRYSLQLLWGDVQTVICIS